ncbi:MAG TPA: DNA N-6-adenine-methyltransferase [Humisphaera sp.]|nr:DNA N-6-adenine-methyltransferase [Humisphaera sp.]
MSAGRSIISISQTWCTPQKYVRAVREVFGGAIALDPCSNEHSIVRAEVEYRLPERDGLHGGWNYPTIYVNPPYGADRQRGTTIKDWLRRCANAREKHGSEVLALVPVATNTKHWKHYVFGAADAVCFLYDTRLRFLVDGKDGGKGAPMSCAMVYWGTSVPHFENIFLRHGAVLDLRGLQGKSIGAGSDEPSLFTDSGALSGGG